MVRAKYIHAQAEYRNFARAGVYFADPTNRPRHNRPLYSCLLDELVFAWQWQEVKSNELLGTFSRKQVTSLVAAGRKMNLSYPCMFSLMVSGKVFNIAPRSSENDNSRIFKSPPIVSYKRGRSLRPFEQNFQSGYCYHRHRKSRPGIPRNFFCNLRWLLSIASCV